MKNISFKVRDFEVSGISLGIIESSEVPGFYSEKHIVYAQNRLVYLTLSIEYPWDESINDYLKEGITTTSEIEIISDYVVMPELDNF